MAAKSSIEYNTAAIVIQLSILPQHSYYNDNMFIILDNLYITEWT